VSYRVRLSQATSLHKPTSDGFLDEGHCLEISGILQTSEDLSRWLTTNQAQAEVVAEVLGTHIGSSAGIKPTVKKVRDAAKRWKALIQAAQDAYESLPDDACREQYVDAVVRERVRTEAGLNRVLSEIVSRKRRHDENAAARLRAEADASDREAERLKQEEARLGFLEAQTSRLFFGDARELMVPILEGFHLLLTDPPYGIEFQSNRRVASGRKPKIANDDPRKAFELLADVLGQAFPLMADDATCLVFTSWRHEPEFRRIIEDAGFTIKGSLVWVKNNHGSGDLSGSFAPKHERIIHAVKGNPKLQHRAADVLTGNAPPTSDHPNEKPRDLLRQLIETTTAPGDVVVDPFMGCGNTVIEAYALGREFFGIELEERWHRVAVDVVHHMAEEEFAHGLAG
jgi:site-specific DNA-methyltransferase (adenine-specific)